MNFFLVAAGSVLGGWAGWFLGSPFGLIPGFLLSLMGTAAGIYLARWFVRTYSG